MGGFVLRRLRAHRLLVVAALLTILLTAAAVSTLAAFSPAVAAAGVQRAFQVTDRSQTPLVMTESTGRSGLDSARSAATATAHSAFPQLPVTLGQLAVSDSYGLPLRHGQNAQTADLTLLADLDPSRVRLVSGAWPTAVGVGAPAGARATAAVDVAVPTAAVARLGGVGTVLDLTDRYTSHSQLLRIVGVYLPRATTDPYWRLDPLAGHGLQPGSTGTNTLYGPLLVPGSDFAGGAVPQQSVTFEATADFGRITVGQLDAVSRATAAAVAASSGSGGASPLQTTSQLPQLITQVQSGLLVARAALLVVSLQLLLLAAMTLLLAARLLAEERETENALLRARGAAPRRIVLLAAAEGLVLAVPAAVCAPLLSGPLLRLVDLSGPMRRAGLDLTAPPLTSVWWAAGLAALVGALLVTAPTLARYRSFTEAGPLAAQRTRRGALPGVLRGGADLALLALALLGYLQLRHYGDSPTGSGVITASASGVAGIDPVLVAAPTLALAAGAVLTLRVLPLLSRLGERLATRGRGLPAALTGWQLARRPQRGAGPVLSLALATAIGVLALGQNSSWLQSQNDQAAFQTGADLRVTGELAPGFGQGGELAAQPGVSAALPVQRETLAMANGKIAELLALDARSETGRLPLRADLIAGPKGADAGDLLRSLPDPAVPADRGGVQLPGRPQMLTLTLRLTTRSGSAQITRGQGPDPVSVDLTDGTGVVWNFPLGSAPEDGVAHSYTLDLAGAAGSGSPAYPLTLSGLSISMPWDLDGPTYDPTATPGNADSSGPPQAQGRTVTAALLSVGTDAGPANFPSGLVWRSQVDWGLSGLYDPSLWCSQGAVRTAAPTTAVPVQATVAGGVCRGLVVEQIGATPTAQVSLTPAPAPGSGSGSGSGGPLAAVVDQQFLTATQSRIGSVVALPADLPGLRIRVVGVVSSLPGTGSAAEQGLGGSGGYGASDSADDAGAVLVDLPSYDHRYLDSGPNGTVSADPQPTEWWLAAAPGASGRVAAELRARPDTGQVFARDEVVAAELGDPLGSGPQAALFGTLALSIVLSAIGFGVDAAGATRRRAGEFALLSALGLRRRAMARATAVELALPVALGVGVGLLLGELLTRLIVPLLVLTPAATRPTPPVQVSVPGGSLLLLTASIAAVPLLVAVLAGLRGGDPARRLRGSEES
ncbi:FtsX-like permease family protein [Streptacidiphilus sp. MAP5-3]|uniref:FtsX-like permease family protein n=1 Tax=unclassified Streptacidiphilus TaxID=2643834 RepID=UPI0035115EFF